jgi:EpsD family peptidyl-prolyl cis-trans isomerase
MALAVTACKPGGPSGQVVATVNGKEITRQDLVAEAKAIGNPHASPQALLQQVIARDLLAQSAHDQKLDGYPGYPSDLVRIQQTFLAEKAVQHLVKPGGAPTPAAIAAFEAAHPYLFAQRAKLQANEIRFVTSDDMKSLQGVEDMPATVSRLKALNTPYQQQSQVLDTAQMPQPIAAHLVTFPLNQLEFIREGNSVLGVVITGRDPATLPSEQQAAMAAQLMGRVAAEKQVNDEVGRLRAKAKIAYQQGYAPSQPANVRPPKAP